jgi:hypothetical protein
MGGLGGFPTLQQEFAHRLAADVIDLFKMASREIAGIPPNPSLMWAIPAVPSRKRSIEVLQTALVNS